MLWGQLTRLGFAAALATALADQASKLWLLYGLDIRARMPLRLTPFLDLVLVWNKGISYGLFQQEGPLGQWVLLAIKAAAVGLLLWLIRARSRLTALSLGLIVGGAVGNAIDPFFHEGVVDFVLFHVSAETVRRFLPDVIADFILLHVSTEPTRFSWYVFNLADAAIVAGVIGLLYEALVGERAAKAPRSPT
jgi:signal peptidase II